MNERKTRLDVTVMDKPVVISLREWRVGRPKGQVICLHGLGVNGAEYAPMAMSLNSAGFDVLAPDWIGHGDSDYLNDPRAYDWTSYVRCLAAIVQRYHGPVTHFVGTSWGGGILLLYLLSLSVRPRSAVLVDVPVRSAPEIPLYGEKLAVLIGQSFSSVAEGNEFLAKVRPTLTRVPKEFQAYLDRERYRLQDGRFVFSFDPETVALRAGSAVWNFDHFDKLKRLSFDTMFLYGAASPLRWPAEYAAFAAKSPLITYVGDMAGGHPPMLLFEEQFGVIVDYIKTKNPAR
ncbi:alpha/beta hydrolase [Nordella sp. HKS 07]|uniref:alpha/beta hydrolase n=1 Tax=Nordella sp. HKS 07 TaxID=2712222 RepID=UPI0013E16C0F|nr:alpha/beta fold hydrolase [Nordella sp. HKS 07]QIG46846.1 alpha/beta hydrolase [Nordella sp. HKS 07]